MVETEYRLEDLASVTLDSDGNGSVVGKGPVQPGERWEIKFFGANGTASARLVIVRGTSNDASRQLDITDRADGDSSSTDVKLQTNEVISFFWTGGVAGAAMTCSIQGSRFVPGRRAY